MKQIHFFEYITKLAEEFPASAQYHASLIWKNNGMILVAFDGENKVGLCMLNPLGGMLDVLYMYVCEPYRRKGIASAFMKHCMICAEKMSKPVCIRIIKQNNYADVFEKLAKENNFQVDNNVSIYITNNKKEFYGNWLKFMEVRGKRILNRLNQKGYKTESFVSAPRDIIKKLQEEIGIQFPSNLNPFSLSNKNDDWSFITYKGNKPVAFSTASYIDGKIIFQQLASGYDYLNKGVFFLPICYFLSKYFEESTNRMNGIVYDNNQRMKKFMDGFLASFIDETKHQVSMVYDHNGKGAYHGRASGTKTYENV